ncbi:MAG: hypothetical protein ACFWUE_08850 [Xylanivirga thermophila]|jgi:tRNA nucleotidyltransferase (CCA-adding enzyme)|uniref:CCA tRNA nucleotidyltransferase n=1 Tax=Xylanivirga thermophila TaxID=2496273 RepID=UPI00101BE993|nr:hypothetical protein [Xylanivirga thermophila]
MQNYPNNIYIPDQIIYIINKIMAAGGQAYIVGGALRDVILEKKPTDWDIATSLPPKKVEIIFDNTIPTGKRFGTITVIVDDMTIEVTTFRGECNYSDFRHPDQIEFVENIEADLSRRDFTINAMAYNPFTSKKWVDPFLGIEDIKYSNIKTVGNPNERFQEDPLRMMRAIRFASQLGFDIDINTKKSIYTNKLLINNIPKERTGDELYKILISPYVIKGISQLNILGLSKIILGYDISPSPSIISYCPPDFPLRMAAFLYTGIINRKDVALDYAKKTMRNLRYSNKLVNDVICILRFASIELDEHQDAYQVRKMMSKIGVVNTIKGLHLKRAILMDNNPSKYQKGLLELYKIEYIVYEIMQNKDPLSIYQLAIDGHDIIRLGIGQKDKKDIGKALGMAHEWVLKDPSLNNKEVLLSRLKYTFRIE